MAFISFWKFMMLAQGGFNVGGKAFCANKSCDDIRFGLHYPCS